MSIRAFVLGVALLALVGWCMVRESVKQTDARYRLAELGRQEDDAKKRIDRLRAEEQELRSSTRLANVIKEKRMSFVVIGSTQAKPREDKRRKPGQVFGDKVHEKRIEELEEMDMASAVQW